VSRCDEIDAARIAARTVTVDEFVVDEYSMLSAEAQQLVDAVDRHGVGVGMRLIAATTQIEDEMVASWVDLFPTRLVFHVPGQADSERLLGVRGDDGAHMLDAVGELIPYLDGHVLPRIRCLRVPGLHVAYLVDQMRSRFPVDLADRAPSSEAMLDPHDGRDGPAPSPDTRLAAVGLPDQSAQTESPADTSQAADWSDAAVDGSAAAFHQVALIGPVALDGGSPSRPRPVPSPGVRVLYRVLGEESLRLTDGSEIEVPASYRRAGEVGAVMAILPDEATLSRLGAVLWQKASEKAARANIYRALSNLRHVFRDVLGDSDAERIVGTVAGVCRWNDALVFIDAQEFLRAIKRADLHRAAAETARGSGDTNARARAIDAAIAEYEDARGWYGGELLPGQEHRYLWLDQPIKGELAARALYAQLHSGPSGAPLAGLARNSRRAPRGARQSSLAHPAAASRRCGRHRQRLEIHRRTEHGVYIKLEPEI
jgi:hypothetical protein